MVRQRLLSLDPKSYHETNVSFCNLHVMQLKSRDSFTYYRTQAQAPARVRTQTRFRGYSSAGMPAELLEVATVRLEVDTPPC